MTIATQVKFSVLVLLAAAAPTQAFGQDAGKVPLNASAADDARLPAASQPSTGRIVREAPNSVCRTKDVTRTSEADTLVRAGRLAEGQARFEAALEAAEEQDPADVVIRACLMNNIGFLELQQRRPELAVEWFRRGLEFNPLPAVLTARLTHNLASAYLALRQLERAEEIACRAVPLAEKAFGPEHPETLFPQSIQAAVHGARGDYARAEPVYRRILYLSEKTWGVRSYEASVAAGNLATVYLLQERFAEAKPLFEQSLAGLRQNPMTAVYEIPQADVGLA
ncbi:MAG: tetratricopeptide repeat protein, partial [Bryobacteraceae bacterium]